MIDFTEYRQSLRSQETASVEDNIHQLPSTDLSGQANHPSDRLLTLMPPLLHGFDLQSHEWQPLPVSDIFPVSWEKQPFERLFLPIDSKDDLKSSLDSILQQDLDDEEQVLRTRRAFQFTGDPGTGKTMAAEFVAEYAERPLYRVNIARSCTTTNEVQTELSKAKYLASSWQCVLLIDNADSLLELPVTADMASNASAFALSRLMYEFQGILIITRSRKCGPMRTHVRFPFKFCLQFPEWCWDYQVSFWTYVLKDNIGVDRIDKDVWRQLPKIVDFGSNGHDIRDIVINAKRLAAQRKCLVDYDTIYTAQRLLETTIRFV